MNELCGNSFPQKHRLKVLPTTNIEIRPYKCNVCSRSFKQKHHLNGHLQTHTAIKLHKCAVCGESFLYISQLKRHVDTHTFVDPTCKENEMNGNKCFSLQGSLPIDSNQRKMLKQSSHNKTLGFKCESCGKSFSQKQRLKIHLTTHLRIKSRKCEICGKSFLRKM